MKIEKTDCSYQVTECDLKFGEQITLDDEVLLPASILDNIRAEVTALKSHHINDSYDNGFQGCRIEVLDILDTYKEESEKE